MRSLNITNLPDEDFVLISDASVEQPRTESPVNLFERMLGPNVTNGLLNLKSCSFETRFPRIC